MHNRDPNRAQIRLINLLFRSIGGSIATNLSEDGDGGDDNAGGGDSSSSPSETTTTPQLEEMGNEEWGEKVTDLVDEMRHTPPDSVLFCADPDGAVHSQALESAMDKDAGVSLRDVAVTNGSLGLREYRKIYEEFWYVLGHVAVVEGGMSSSSGLTAAVPFNEDEIESSNDETDNDEEVEEEEQVQEQEQEQEQEQGGKSKSKKRTLKAKKASKKPKAAAAAQRFDTEVVRDILSRVVELVTVGQPDVRAAATCAVLSLAHAILDKTVYLSDKLDIATRQFAAAIGGGGNKGKSKSKNATSAKAESLRFQIDSLKRTRANLEEIVEALVIKGVFIHRYRDANMFIRAMSMQALGTMVVRRPELFLKDKYLKYFGWMLSDKAECVRIAALQALNRPFEVVQEAEKNGREVHFDLTLLEHVTVKFVERIVDCAIDTHASVQEGGVKLMLSLLRAGFLDDVDDEKMWNQVNTLAFESASTPALRTNALYFIMEQLEEFDEGNDEEKKLSGNKRKSTPGASKSSERRIAQRLDAIASWAAHTLTDGEVPIDKIQIHLVDHLVNSLRDMPEHKDIVTNWSAMIRAITDDKAAKTSQGNAAGDRADVAKQRVLVQMLACAAKAEVESVTDPEFLLSDFDPDEAGILQKSAALREAAKGPRKGVPSKGLNHEALSVALIKALPNLLEKFKSDSKILESLTALPRYFGEYSSSLALSISALV